MSKLFTAYRILALAVGVFLLTASIFYVTQHDVWWLWMLHGYLYIVYLIVAFIFTRKAGYSLGFFAVMILAGLIPVTMFFVEHYVAAKFKREHPELVAA